MNKWKKLLAVGLAAAAVLSLSGFGFNKKSETDQVNIGYFNNVTHAQALYMKAEGVLEKSLGSDVSVNWTAFNAGPAEVEALFAGDIDIGYIGPVPAISANVKSDGDVAILSGATKGGAILLKRADADIESIADLSGKIVAVPQLGNTQHLSLLQLLADNDLKPASDGGTVTVSAVANADIGNLMERGDIDAALVPEPWGATLLSKGAELLLDYDQIYMDGDYDVAVVVVRTEFMEEHPEIAEAFLAEHEKATDKINEDTAAAIAIINDELKSATMQALDEDILAEAFTRIGVSAELNQESVLGFADISLDQGFINELPGDSLFVE